MASFKPEFETCPSCGAAGCCRIHAYYDRSVIDFSKGHTVKSSLCVMRARCQSCGHTHAVLPDVLIPYRSYSLIFILTILARYFLFADSAEKVCEHYGISLNYFRELLVLWKKHKVLWLGVLNDLETDGASFIRFLITSVEAPMGLILFRQRYQISFLQHHQNPPPS